jgi:hypothetical protein
MNLRASRLKGELRGAVKKAQGLGMCVVSGLDATAFGVEEMIIHIPR